MFVQTNSVKSIRSYFQDKLGDKFSENEIKLIGNDVIFSRLNLSNNDLIGLNEKLLSESDLLYFRSVVKRLLNNEPFQYVVENAHFYGLVLKCDKRALIPRPETEELVEWVKDTFKVLKLETVVDLCTGSGCIGLALKSVFPNAEVVLTDYSSDALELAKENSLLTNLDVSFEKFDATDFNEYEKIFGSRKDTFNCWVSNPPYIPVEEMKLMSENVLEHEPHMALFVPNDQALVFYHSISKMAQFYLKTGGYLFFEIHENLADEVVNVLKENNFIDIEVRKDLQGKDRMVKAKKV